MKAARASGLGKTDAPFWSSGWVRLTPFAIAAFGLAIWGFGRCLGDACTPNTPVEILEKSINLVRGRGSFTIEDDPWQLVVAQWLVPGLALVAAAKLFLDGLRRDMRLVVARRSRDHVIVCGLGDTGRQVVENLRAGKATVVAVDLKGDSENASACEALGVPVIPGDVTSPAALRVAGIARARAVVLCTGDDAVNVEAALAAAESIGRGASSHGATILPELRTGWLFARIAGHDAAALGSEAAAIRPFNPDENAARLLYRTPFFLRGPADGSTGLPHLLVVGFGGLGQEVVAHGLRTALALPHRKPRVTVLQTQGERTSERFAQAHPGIETVADIAFDATRLGPGESAGWEAVETACRDHLTAAIVCVPDDSDGLFIAGGLRDRLDRLGHVATPVFVAVADRTRLGAFFGGLESGGWLPHRLVPFGSRAELLGAAVLIDDALDRLARAQHEAFRAAGSAGGRDWAVLPEALKRSNRLVADHLGVKLRLAGLRAVESAAPRALDLTEAEIEALAAAEHWRWLVERRLAGWTRAPVRDDPRRHHPLLASWKDLDEPARRLNRSALAPLAGMLAGLGLELRRERVVAGGAIGAALDGFDPGGREHLICEIDPTDAGAAALAARIGRTEHVSIRVAVTPGLAPTGAAALDRIEGYRTESPARRHARKAARPAEPEAHIGEPLK